MHVNCGVPQGSILGSLLFMCYANDLKRYCLHTMPFVYMDDTDLLCTGDSPDNVERKLQSDLDILSKWFVVNKLSVNVRKTSLQVAVLS